MTPDEKTELHDVDAAIRRMRYDHADAPPGYWSVGAQAQYERLRARRRELLARVGLPNAADQVDLGGEGRAG